MIELRSIFSRNCCGSRSIPRLASLGAFAVALAVTPRLAVGTALAAPVKRTIYSFGDTGIDDGAVPEGSLTWDGTTLFGRTTTTVKGNGGVIFEINPDGTGYAIVHGFRGKPNDGANPRHDAMTLFNGLLYGTTLQGGDSNDGIIFSIATDGTNYSVLHNFHQSSGDQSHSCFLNLSGTLYGMTAAGGGGDHGTMFQINPDGSGYHHNYGFHLTGGTDPHGALAESGGVLYGMTRAGGKHGLGVIFSVNPDGSGYQVLHDFKGGHHDGATTDHGYVTISGSTMYGMTTEGGEKGVGVVYSMNLDGSNFQILRSFGTPPSTSLTPGVTIAGYGDGRKPYGSLLLNGTDLYGTTAAGGQFGVGTVFHITTAGTGYAILHSFSGKPDGKKPIDNVILINNMLYGMTSAGGAHKLGAIFAVPVTGD